MKLFSSARSLLRGYRVLRAILAQQQAQTALMTQMTLALQSIAASQRLMAQSEFGAGGFVTGPPDGKDEAGLVRQSDAELAELLAIEAVLAQRLGRSPSDQETVAAWEEWRAGR